jgi:hypothetical protein
MLIELLKLFLDHRRLFFIKIGSPRQVDTTFPGIYIISLSFCSFASCSRLAFFLFSLFAYSGDVLLVVPRFAWHWWLS